MKISIFGAGYVGCVSAGCFAKLGHQVDLIEINPQKVSLINQGKSPIVENGLDDLIFQAISKGKLHAMTSFDSTVLQADAMLLCLPTPSLPTGEPDLRTIELLFQEIKKKLVPYDESLILAIRSTVPPDQIRHLFNVNFTASPRKVELVLNPEFMREASAIDDFFNPPFCIVGCDDRETANRFLTLYENVKCSKYVVDLETAALIKYGCNAFHALKITFANEMGSIASSLGSDPVLMMKILADDKILNASSAYLRPGFSFGGSCLPKDLRGLIVLGKQKNVSTELFESITHCNRARINLAVEEILRSGIRRLAVLGMSFKKGSDDLRESPYIELIEQLIGKGCSVKIFDPDVQLDKLHGSNLNYFTQRFHHLFPLLEERLDEVLNDCQLVVLCKKLISPQHIQELLLKGYRIFDLEYVAASLNASTMQSGLFEIVLEDSKLEQTTVLA